MNRVMVAGMKSHSGKTLITCALLEILRRRNLDPASYKCGPDYIDPMFHESVPGIECRNLDTFFAGGSGVRDLISQCRHHCAVIEGVMGLYDGSDRGSTAGSSYEIASVTATPIILIVDVSGIGRTVLSLIRGILEDDTEHLIRGLILNRCSAGRYTDLQSVLEPELCVAGYHVRFLGAVPASDDLRLESRHLGLVLPAEIADLQAMICRLADLMEKCVDIEGLLDLMKEAGRNGRGCVQGETDSNGRDPLRGKQDVSEISSGGSGLRSPEKPLTLAVARDEAFCFYYKENLEMFENRGVRIRWFSPLHDRQIPADADGILLGGGYPENYLFQLSQNQTMLDSVKEAVDKGIPSLAECGGFLYLHTAAADRDGRSYKLAGVIDGDCWYTGHLVRFGYMEIEAVNKPGKSGDGFTESLVGMRGHEFHYYESSCKEGAYVAKKPFRDVRWSCIAAGKNGIWGFPHFYYGSNQRFLECFVSRMRRQSPLSP